jgi:hypothetical protein
MDDFTLEPVILVDAALQTAAAQNQDEVGCAADQFQKPFVESAHLKLIHVKKYPFIEFLFKQQFQERRNMAAAFPSVADKGIIRFDVFLESGSTSGAEAGFQSGL